MNEVDTFRLLRRINYFDMKTLLIKNVWYPSIPLRSLEGEEIEQLLLDNGWTKPEYLKAEKDYGDVS